MSVRDSGVEFAGDGGVSSISLPVSGRVLRSSGGDWLRVQWRDGGSAKFSDLAWKPEQDGVLRGAVTRDRGRALEVRAARSEDADGLTRRDITLTNLSPVPLDVCAVRLLDVREMPPGWFCTLPFGGGWAIALEDFPDGRTVALRYPVQGSLQWIELFCESEGISFQTRDPVPWLKDFEITRARQGLSVSVAHRHLAIGQGETLTLPPVLLGAHAGDWQVGAASYAGWLSGVMTPAEAPDWLRRSPGWAWVGGRNQYSEKLDTPYPELPARSADFAASGLECIQFSGWLENGHDTRYPDYVAGESFGGAQALRQAARDIHAAGRRMALYTNGRLFDPLSETAKEHPEWKSWAVAAPAGRTLKESIADEFIGVTTDVPLPDWDPDDEIAKEIYGRVVFATMCPSAPGWQHEYARRLAHAAREYEVDGLYLDQVLGAVAVPCFSPEHSHSRPYESWRGYHNLLRLVRERVKAARPEAYLATEGFSDILSQYFDLVQSHNDWPGPCPEGAFAFPEMTRHAVPWLMQAAGPVREGQLEMLRLVHAAASGMDLACFRNPPEGAFSAAIRLFMEWRERFSGELFGGRPVPAWIEGFPGRRVTAVLGRRLVICCSDIAGEGKASMAIRVGTSGWRVADGRLNWESGSGSGMVDVRLEDGVIGASIPASDMAILWGDVERI